MFHQNSYSIRTPLITSGNPCMGASKMGTSVDGHPVIATRRVNNCRPDVSVRDLTRSQIDLIPNLCKLCDDGDMGTILDQDIAGLCVQARLLVAVPARCIRIPILRVGTESPRASNVPARCIRIPISKVNTADIPPANIIPPIPA